MHDPWLEKISESIDGLLSPSDEQALQAHLAECAECRDIAADLRSVVTAARGATLAEPDSDLWPGISARIAEAGRDAAPIRAHAGTSPRVAPHGDRRARRFSFSVPQLAAAATVLMALSGTAVWLAGGRTQTPPAEVGTIIQSADAQERSIRPVSLPTESPEYVEDVADLERALDANRAQLDPATVEIIEQSLESIDRAIADARAALEADPGNPYLHRQLDNTMRKKIDVLRRATGARRAQS